MAIPLKNLLSQVRDCTICADHLPLGPRPVLQMSPRAKVLIVGQAPGTAVHASGVPFDDPSGDRLRSWLGVDKDTFYDADKIALLPMGFCYPGRGKGGDLPPRPECAEAWRDKLLAHLDQVELTVAVGRYAIDWHLKPERKQTLAQVVAEWPNYFPDLVPLPHPSPRNTLWLRKHPWVEAELVPKLQTQVAKTLGVT